MMNTLKLASANVHGFTKLRKAKDKFSITQKGAFDVICIHRLYTTHADKEVCEREWGGSLFYTSVTGHCMGQTIWLGGEMDVLVFSK